MAEPGLDSFEQAQFESFGLTSASRLTSTKSAERFLKNAGVALRYWRAEKLPLASLYQAAHGSPSAPPKEKGPGIREEALRIGIELTNHLLGSQIGIEVNMIADRISLVHRDLVPFLYVLVRRHKPPDDLTGLSPQSKKVFKFVMDSRETTAGLVRKFLGGKVVDLNNDPAYNALAELQRNFLVDRGPFIVREKGIAYLSKEGYPYHCFHVAHGDLVKEAAKLSVDAAAYEFIYRYLKGAAYAAEKKIKSMFEAFVSGAEVDGAVTKLLGQKKIMLVSGSGKNRVLAVAGLGKKK